MSRVLVALFLMSFAALAAEKPSAPDASRVDFRWGVKIPLRDGVHLNGTVYTPRDQKDPAPCIFTLTPYIAQSYHDRGLYFAAHGFPFLTVDVRGRDMSLEGIADPELRLVLDFGSTCAETHASDVDCSFLKNGARIRCR